MTRLAARPGRSVAVLIAAHNEELVIGATLESVIASYGAEHVYVFDDASTDSTVRIARRYVPAENVIEHEKNVGKSRGLEYALTRHVYPAGYDFVTIVDADTTLEPAYLSQALGALEDPGVACAAGQVKSRPYAGNVISLYRACLYFLWQGLFKRLQSAVNAIAIAPGCASTWRVSALRRIEFNHRMSTEDFHLSLQAHRLGLGRIKYVHGAVVWTQDPLTFRAFLRQARRWSRAWWEAVRFHKLGLRWVRRGAVGRWRVSGLDIGNALLIVAMEVFFLRLLMLLFFLVVPLTPQPGWLFPDSTGGLMLQLVVQGAVILASIMLAAAATGRLSMVPAAPVIAGLMVVEYVMSTAALIAVLRRLYPVPRMSGTAGVWASPERRRVLASRAPGPLTSEDR